MDRHEMVIPVDPSGGGPALARAAVTDILEDSGMDQAQIQDAVLMTSELVTNGIRHARIPPDETLELQVDLTPSAIRIEVADAGGNSTPIEVQPTANASGGWGLYLVERLADRWGAIQNAANVVWFEMDR
jgi:anti-sigma regulatory factor (Ser/Thr protein kinase)